MPILFDGKRPTDPDTARSFISFVGQTAGLFLGLYYAALGTVVGAAYSNLPQSLRWLLLKERVGNLYTFLTSVLVASSLLFLYLDTIGYEVNYNSLIIVTALGLFSALSFIPVGRQVFDLFNLLNVIGEPYHDIYRAISRTVKGWFPNSPSVQRSSFLKTNHSLNTFEEMIAVSSQRKFDRNVMLVRIIQLLSRLLVEYVQLKGRIASKSKWFPTVYQHESWLTADSTKITTSLHAGVPLFPKELQDLNWFESRIYDLIESALKPLFRTHDLVALTQAFQTLGDAAALMARKQCSSEACELTKKLISNIQTYFETFPDDQRATIHKLTKDSPGMLVAQLGYVIPQLVVEIGRAVQELSSETLEQVAEELLRNPNNISLKDSLPRTVLDEVYRLADKLSFEIFSEGRVVTRKWYVLQILELSFTWHIEKLLDDIKGLSSEFFKPENFLKDPAIPSLVECFRCTVGIEFSEKLDFHIGMIRARFDELKKSRRASDIPFPDIEFDEILLSFSSLRKIMVKRLSTHAVLLGFAKRNSDLPDFFGQAYFLSIQESRNSLKVSSVEDFKVFFNLAFSSALTAFNKVSEELESHPEETRIVFMTESIEEIMCLSGFGLIYAEFDGVAFDKVVIEAWDNYLSSVPDRLQAIKFLLSTVSYRKGTFGLMPRSVLRSSWDIELTHEFQKRELINDDIYHDPFSTKESVTYKTNSSLLKVLGRSHFDINKSLEAFVCLYLLNQPEATGLDLPASVDSFRQSLERASNE